MTRKRILVIGYGNPSRGDDGLGPALAERIEAMRIPGVTVESDYQLTIEHAALAAEHEAVVFADAAADAKWPFDFRELAPAAPASFSSHSVTPGQVLRLAHTCFNASPTGFVLGIRAQILGRFSDGLSAPARDALDAAVEHLCRFIRDR